MNQSYRPKFMIDGARYLLETGLLGEINRLILHPRGLSLLTLNSPDGMVVQISNQLLDARESPEFLVMGPVMLEMLRDKLQTAQPVSPERKKLFPPDGVEPLKKLDA